MEIKDIKRLLDAVAAADVSEFAYETGDFKLSVKRGAEPVVDESVRHSPPPAVRSEPEGSPGSLEPAPVAIPAEPQSRYSEVVAPIVGTFYASPAPGAEPFVKVGDRVQAGTVLCIIEAMKLMNEIEAETAGTIAEVLVNNEAPVEYGQTLFRIDPG